MGILSSIAIILGITSIIYYVLIAIYVSNLTGFALIWLFAGTLIMALGIAMKKTDITKFFPHKKINIGIFCIFLIIFLLFCLIEGIIIYSANCKPTGEADYVLVLGARVNGDKISKSLKFRLETAIQYIDEHPSVTVIVSGGQGPGEDITEADAMYNYLIEHGVKDSQIVKEDKSTNTNENILFTKKLIDTDAKVVIVSSGFHIFRATRLAECNGFSDVEGLGARTAILLAVNQYVREAVGIAKDVTFGNMTLF